MARRPLLTSEERRLFFGIPDDPDTVARRYTFTRSDQDRVTGRRGAANRLGFAVRIADAYIRPETYQVALARIINAHHALPIAAIWGDGTTSSSDGQFFRSAKRGDAAGDINARYGPNLYGRFDVKGVS